MRFRQLRHYQKVVNVSYWYMKMKYVCIYACCVTRTELLLGEAGKSSACVMDIIWEELKRNNIDIDKDMLSFYISKCFDEQREMYDSLNHRLSPMCFQPIFEEMHVNNFGRIVPYLALVYKVRDSYYEETLREAVRKTVQDLKHIDLEKYTVKWSISFKALLVRQHFRLFCDVMCLIQSGPKITRTVEKLANNKGTREIHPPFPPSPPPPRSQCWSPMLSTLNIS